jgi:hypothetical protein
MFWYLRVRAGPLRLVAEEAVTSELLSPKNKEKYRENSAE